jgi:hypothetical protein
VQLRHQAKELRNPRQNVRLEVQALESEHAPRKAMRKLTEIVRVIVVDRVLHNPPRRVRLEKLADRSRSSSLSSIRYANSRRPSESAQIEMDTAANGPVFLARPQTFGTRFFVPVSQKGKNSKNGH